MKKVILSPSKYIQGENEISKLSNYSKIYGDKPLIVFDKYVFDNMKEDILSSFDENEFLYTCFNGISSKEEINRIIKMYNENSCNLIIGVGGGSNADTVKAATYYLNCSTIIVPTVASTSASCTNLSVIYNKNGEFEEYLRLKNNPEMVLVDTAIIAKSPTRFLIAGIGDALATKFEARAVKKSKKTNHAGGLCSDAAMQLASLTYKILIDESERAINAISNGYATESLDRLIEATIYLSSIGSESGGLAAAHSIHNGFTKIKQTKEYMHGEIVAFATICQLVLEGASKEEINEVIDFCKRISLPTNLSGIGIKSIKDINWDIVLTTILNKNETIHNMPFNIDSDKLKDSILFADKIGS